jgi:hypothetical protein
MILHRCQIPEWKERAINYAHTLKGRENTEEEQKYLDTHPDPWDFLFVFGTDETRQGYINATIRLIEECDNLGDQIICELRLDWSSERLKGIPFHCKEYKPIKVDLDKKPE